MLVDSSAPTRIDLAGGTFDIWPLYLFHPGAQTVNAALSLRARCRLAARADRWIGIHSHDAGCQREAADAGSLAESPDLRLIALLAAHFGARGVTIETRSESPVGAGIAGSSAMGIAVAAALARWTGRDLDEDALMRVVMDVEAQTIGVPTGYQDYRPAVYGGVMAVELGVGAVRRVELDCDLPALNSRLVLAHTGASRNSGVNNWEVTKRHLDGDQHVRRAFDEIAAIASETRKAIEAGDWTTLARLLDREWEARKRLAPRVTTPEIDEMASTARRAGARAAKLCGAGGGGCLVCLADPGDAPAVRAALTAAGARVLAAGIDLEGLLVSEGQSEEPQPRPTGRRE